MHHLRQGPGGRGRWARTLLLATALASSAACGSYLSDTQLLSANDAEFRTTPGAPGTGPGVAGQPVPASPGGAGSDAALQSAGPAGSTGGSAAGPSGAPGVIPAAGPTRAGTSGAAGATGSARAAGGSAAAGGVGTGPAGAGGSPAAGAPAPAAGSGAAALPGLKSDGSVIKLGSIAVRSGPLGAAMQPAIDSSRAWVNDVNARGGLAGHPVELVAVDDRGDPSTALALARRLVEQDGVLAIYATGMPTTEQSVAPYLQQKGVPIIGGCICNTQVEDSQIVFQVGYGSKKGLSWAQLAPVLDGSDKRRAAVLYCREAQTCSDLRDAIHDWVEKGGVPIQIVYEAQISIAQPDFTGEVIQARNAGADVIVTLAENPTTIRVARSAHRQNWNPVIATQQGGSDERYIRDGGADVAGSLISHTTASWVNSPLMADYREAMARYVPGGARGGMGANVWVAGKLIEKLAEHFPAHPTSADVLNGLYSLHGETLGGRIPPTTYTRGKGNADVNLCSVTARIEGGKWVELKGPETFTCAPGWKPGS
ncbi:MAG TPA: ABC transporter substrate-binding protein [Acidimicrobiia bacterium]|nr:ABC transporter substrate-binding protein [Acidimicrobiia bacterium]